MADEHRNGSAGGFGGRAARAEEANRRLEENQESRRHWRRLRALIDTLCEIQAAAVGARGVDKSTKLRLFADAVEEALPTLAKQGALARAEAIDLDRGMYAPASAPPDETSETRRRRAARSDSSPGHRRS